MSVIGVRVKHDGREYEAHVNADRSVSIYEGNEHIGEGWWWASMIVGDGVNVSEAARFALADAMRSAIEFYDRWRAS